VRRGATVLPERKPFSRVGLATPAAFAPEVLEPWRGSGWRTDSCCPARRSLSGCAHSATGRATGRAVPSADAGRRHRLTSGNDLWKQPRSALRRARRAPPSRSSLVVARGKPYHARSMIGSRSWSRRWRTGSSWGRGAFQHRCRTKGVGLLRWLQQARQAHRCHGPLDRSGGMTLPELRRAWQACSDRPPTRWSQVRGPIEAAWVSAQRLVWTWPGACFVLVADGTRISLVENAPAAVAIEAQKAYFSDLQCKVAERARLGDAGGICLRPVWVVAADRELSASQRRLVQVVVCGGVWTNQRLQEAGYDVIPVCRCGNDIDSLHQAIPLPFVC